METSSTDESRVVNVCIENFPIGMQTQIICEHFQKFGNVSKVRIIETQPAKCLIQFEEAWSAAAVLKIGKHRIPFHNQIVNVTPCDKSDRQYQIDYNGPNLTIFVLNDDCLLEIFKFLNLRDQIRVSMSHPRLEQSFTNLICYLTSRKVRLNDLKYCSNTERRHFLKIAGRHLNYIEVENSFYNRTCETDLIYDFIKKFCTNVERLQVTGNQLAAINFLNAVNLEKITGVDLHSCDLEDSELSILQEARKLKDFGLEEDDGMHGVILNYLTQIRRLKLRSCGNIKLENLINIFQMRKLRYLDLRGTFLGQKYYMLLDKDYFTELETLKLTVDTDAADDLRIFSPLPKLRYLHVESEDANIPQIAKYAKNLEVLKLRSKLLPSTNDFNDFKNLHTLWLFKVDVSESLITEISNIENLVELHIEYSELFEESYIIQIIKGSNKLMRLSLGYKCISKDFLLQIIDILEQSRVRRKKLTMFIDEIDMDKSFFQHPKYQMSRQLFQIDLNTFKFDWFLDFFLNED